MACRCNNNRLAGTKSDESTLIASLRTVVDVGVKVTLVAAGFNVDRRSTRLLLFAAVDGVSLDIEECDLSKREKKKKTFIYRSHVKHS